MIFRVLLRVGCVAFASALIVMTALAPRGTAAAEDAGDADASPVGLLMLRPIEGQPTWSVHDTDLEARITQAFGPPDVRESELVAGGGLSRTEFVDLIYPHLKFEIFGAEGSTGRLLFSIDLFGPGVRTRSGIGVGSPRSALKQLADAVGEISEERDFGLSETGDSMSIHYTSYGNLPDFPEPLYCKLKATLDKNGNISRLVWTYGAGH